MNDFKEFLKEMMVPIISESIQKNIQNGLLNSNTQSLPEFLTQDQAATYLGISKSALSAMTSKSEIAYHKKGRRNYFKRTDLRNWLESHEDVHFQK
ncbi:MAG: helix-turn-helix domain-containing protein [Bacteroidetes bacterium]|jgi:excisionase family DNA binding protein|nr:helix-turn-helix domain-containing protein [Bacteroidota bacterium]MBT4401128.1 helix-turn-helix domain-containing protein [Bacteroidota bacterium]MBT5426897.1 helix-turn-helix domain-containing protein [Bacteroidota bacterium]MBT7466446.1 helix-turn-helix domain-containing protein [Bacteroidota bacterium]